MRRLVVVGVGLLAAGGLGAVQAASAPTRGSAPEARQAVCHRTASKARPYVRVVLGGAALRKALASSDDIVPAPRSCPQSLLTASGGGTEIDANMLGIAEQPDLGDPDGTGTAVIRLRQGQARVCFRLAVQNLGTVAAAHIHKGGPEASGPVVVPLAPPVSGSSAGCVKTPRAVVKDILANRAGYYVNVHTADFGGGAVRAQLGPTQGIALFRATMLGANEKPSPADPNGTGTGQFFVDSNSGRICYALVVKNIALPAIAAHIHKGDADTAGPVVVPFTAPNADGVSSACITADPTLLKDIVANPAGYYANVHTRQFAGGAVRGQLSPA
jgi:hypothetical protein